MKAIGIDIGTTTISAVVLDTDQKKVKEVRTIPNGSFIRTGYEWEHVQDTAVIWERGKGVLDELLKLYPDTGSVGLTGQMHGILYTDQEGRGISPLYTWQDDRGNLPEADGQTLAGRVKREYGITVPAGYGLLTHLYNLRHGLVPKGSVSLCTIADYIGMRLTGRKRPLVHISNAASMGFFDSEKGCFQKSILQKLGMDTSLLPEVTDQFDVLGTCQGILVTVGLGDNQASFLGSAGTRENTLLLNMGTGGQICVLSRKHFEAPGIEARPFIKGRYLLSGASLCGGRAYAILERFFRMYAEAAGQRSECQYSVMEKLAEKGMKEYSRMNVCTAFNGTRADPKQRGSITGITEENFTPEGLVYGVLNGMAQELYDMYEVIRQGTGIHAKHIVASGNGMRRNPVLQDICRRMFGAKLELAACEEEAASGAAVSSMNLLQDPCGS